MNEHSVNIRNFAQSSEKNKLPILEVLQRHFAELETILEIGSGTGQHAVYFAEKMPYLKWVTSDQLEYHAGIRLWLADTARENISGPLELDVNQAGWPVINVDAVFTANTAHIMSWPSVINMFSGVGKILKPQGLFCMYGPFNYNGTYTSESNRDFDQWLKDRDQQSGVRDFEALLELARENEMTLVADHEMPANNRTLVWQKVRVIEQA